MGQVGPSQSDHLQPTLAHSGTISTRYSALLDAVDSYGCDHVFHA